MSLTLQVPSRSAIVTVAAHKLPWSHRHLPGTPCFARLRRHSQHLSSVSFLFVSAHLQLFRVFKRSRSRVTHLLERRGLSAPVFSSQFQSAKRMVGKRWLSNHTAELKLGLCHFKAASPWVKKLHRSFVHEDEELRLCSTLRGLSVCSCHSVLLLRDVYTSIFQICP